MQCNCNLWANIYEGSVACIYMGNVTGTYKDNLALWLALMAVVFLALMFCCAGWNYEGTLSGTLRLTCQAFMG